MVKAAVQVVAEGRERGVRVRGGGEGRDMPCAHRSLRRSKRSRNSTSGGSRSSSRRRSSGRKSSSGSYCSRKSRKRRKRKRERKGGYSVGVPTLALPLPWIENLPTAIALKVLTRFLVTTSTTYWVKSLMTSHLHGQSVLSSSPTTSLMAMLLLMLQVLLLALIAMAVDMDLRKMVAC
jgi:hypothetical protein